MAVTPVISQARGPIGSASEYRGWFRDPVFFQRFKRVVRYGEALCRTTNTVQNVAATVIGATFALAAYNVLARDFRKLANGGLLLAKAARYGVNDEKKADEWTLQWGLKRICPIFLLLVGADILIQSGVKFWGVQVGAELGKKWDMASWFCGSAGNASSALLMGTNTVWAIYTARQLKPEATANPGSNVEQERNERMASTVGWTLDCIKYTSKFLLLNVVPVSAASHIKFIPLMAAQLKSVFEISNKLMNGSW